MLELNRGRRREGGKEGLKIITGVSVIRRKNRMRARKNKNKVALSQTGNVMVETCGQLVKTIPSPLEENAERTLVNFDVTSSRNGKIKKK